MVQKLMAGKWSTQPKIRTAHMNVENVPCGQQPLLGCFVLPIPPNVKFSFKVALRMSQKNVCTLSNVHVHTVQGRGQTAICWIAVCNRHFQSLPTTAYIPWTANYVPLMFTIWTASWSSSPVNWKYFPRFKIRFCMMPGFTLDPIKCPAYWSL